MTDMGQAIYETLDRLGHGPSRKSQVSTAASGENKAVILRYYDDLWNPWNLEAAAGIISPNIEFRGSLGIAVQGIEAFKGYVSTVRAAFPDFHNQVEDLLAEGDMIVARLTYRGTHRGEMFGIPPTGKVVEYTGIAVFRVSGGLVHEGWVMGDAWGLYQQLSLTIAVDQDSIESPA